MQMDKLEFTLRWVLARSDLYGKAPEAETVRAIQAYDDVVATVISQETREGVLNMLGIPVTTTSRSNFPLHAELCKYLYFRRNKAYNIIGAAQSCELTAPIGPEFTLAFDMPGLRLPDAAFDYRPGQIKPTIVIAYSDLMLVKCMSRVS